jgi:hypothetical protein
LITLKPEHVGTAAEDITCRVQLRRQLPWDSQPRLPMTPGGVRAGVHLQVSGFMPVSEVWNGPPERNGTTLAAGIAAMQARHVGSFMSFLLDGAPGGTSNGPSRRSLGPAPQVTNVTTRGAQVGITVRPTSYQWQEGPCVPHLLG